jgi:hypothetical protein
MGSTSTATYVAVDVKVGVEVIVEDNVKLRPLPEQGRGVLQDVGSDRRQERDAGDLGHPRTRNWSTPWCVRRCAFISSHMLARAR